MMNLFFAVFNAADCNKKSFFNILPHWWEYLKTAPDPLGQCVPVVNFPNDILGIGLAIIDILLRLAGIIAVVSIVIAGASHLFTGGSPEKASAARRRLFNSIIGLIIALTATLVVTFIGNQLT